MAAQLPVYDPNRLSNLRLHSSLALSSQRHSSLRKKSLESSKKANKPVYKPIKVIGQGAFGVVYSAKDQNGNIVAIKKVLQDPRYKNREFETIQSIDNQYCVKLLNHFRTAGRKPNEVYLNLVMEYMPTSLHQFNLNYRKQRKYPPLLYVKLFAFQMFSGLAYLHAQGVTHRDMKPQNILVDSEAGTLKICDFGSAKKLLPNERSVSYIASRYYRAPELIFNCVLYTEAIDIWAGGCVLAEILMAGMPMFAGETSMGQLNEIVKVLGQPTDEDMNSFQHSGDVPVPNLPQTPIEEVLPRHTPPEILSLLKQIFVYNPKSRPTALECLTHPCFDELFEFDLTMPDGRPFPVLDRKPVFPKSL